MIRPTEERVLEELIRKAVTRHESWADEDYLVWLRGRLDVDHGELQAALRLLHGAGHIVGSGDESVVWVQVTDRGLKQSIAEVYPRYTALRAEVIGELLRHRERLRRLNESEHEQEWSSTPVLFTSSLIHSYKERSAVEFIVRDLEGQRLISVKDGAVLAVSSDLAPDS